MSETPKDVVISIYRLAHKHSSLHRDEIESSDWCACFYCQDSFGPEEIVVWTDKGMTALCPYCGIDAVIGLEAGYEFSDEFLQGMNDYWFH